MNNQQKYSELTNMIKNLSENILKLNPSSLSEDLVNSKIINNDNKITNNTSVKENEPTVVESSVEQSPSVKLKEILEQSIQKTPEPKTPEPKTPEPKTPEPKTPEECIKSIFEKLTDIVELLNKKD